MMGKELARTWRDAIRIFVPPKKPYDLRLWRDVHTWFLKAVCIWGVYLSLPWVIQLIKVLKY